MTTFCEQLKLLLWKNFLLRRRNKIRMVIEFFWPLVLFLILVWVRTRGLKSNEPSCHLATKPLPSVGGFEFFQSTLCSLNNSCYNKYVEDDNNLWKNSGINRLINESTPIIQQILNNNRTVSTVNNLWRNINSFVTVTNGIRSRAEINEMGQIKVQDLMSDEGKQSFLLIAPLYLGLTDEELDGLFNTVIHLEALNTHSLNAFMDQLRRGDCGPNTTMDILTFPSPQIYETLCKLGVERSFIFENIFKTFMSGNGVARKIRSGMIADDIENDSTNDSAYDQDVLSAYFDLMKIFSRNAINISDFLNSSVPISGTDTAQFFTFICGSAAGASNTTMFGLVPDQANRYDSLRDNLMQWHKDNHYEPDPNISAVCNTIFLRFEATPLSSILWRQIKPFIRGSIFYAPDTNYTRKIMEKVEEKFGAIRDTETVINAFVNIIHRVRYWMRNNTVEVENIQEMLSDPRFVKMVINMLDSGMSEADKKQVLQMFTMIAQQDIAKTLERLDLVVEVVSELVSCIKYNKTRGFETEEEAVAAALPLLPLNSLWAVVVFPGIETDPPPLHIHVKIRMDSDKVDGTGAIRDRLTSKTPRRRPIFDLKYITHGFIYLQELIEQSIIEITTGKSMAGTTFYLQQMPFPCHIVDQFIRAISRTFPLFMVLSWVYASSMIIKSIVYEKEKRLREIMKVMGLGNMVIWTGWFIDSFAVLSVSATVLSCILKWGKVIEKADFSLILVFMLSFTVSAICFSFLISTFFNRANSAAAAGGVIFFLMYLPYNMLLIWEDRLSWYHIFTGCFISNVAFGFGCTYFARLEEDGLGAQWDRITFSSLPNDYFNLSYCLIMLWVDSILYILLALYIEAVVPGSYGTPKPWYFIFQKSTYYTQSHTKGVPQISKSLSVDSEGEQVFLDSEPENATCGVVVTNLCKTYSNGKVALRNLNLNFYENQITSFLGHNGAGKTTTISILTGLFPPTTGTAYIYGNNIKTDMDQIRKDVGICPQFEVLFDRLTVEDHMKFYAGLKGNDGKELKAEIDKMLDDLGIPQKRHEFPGNLSGGMKRKLSVAIAFIGGSKTVFLDEPTSGVDPYSRRSIWELLLKYKQGRTVILTTHFMDEADLLGDRIAIISQGKLKTCGSSLYLKNQFGLGYSLCLVRTEERNGNGFSEGKQAWLAGDASSSQEVLNTSGRENHWEASQLEGNREGLDDSSRRVYRKPTSLLTSFVQFRVPEATLVDDVGSEVVFLLPYSQSKSFSKLFGDLDSNLGNLGVASYGISDTTLEEIFLRITVEDIQDPVSYYSQAKKLKMHRICCCLKPSEKTKVNDLDSNRIQVNAGATSQSAAAQINNSDDVTDDTVTLNNSSELSTRPESIALLETGYDIPQRSESQKSKKHNCCTIYFIQVCAIMKKRARNSSRNLKAMFFEIILPAVFIGLTLAFTLILPRPNDEDILELTPFHYPAPSNIFFSDSSPPSYFRERHSAFNMSSSNDPTQVILNVDFENGTSINSSVEEDYFTGIINELTGPFGMGTECLDLNLKRGVCDRTKWSPDRVASFHERRRVFTKEDAKLDDCSCKTGTQTCPSTSVKRKPPPHFHTQTNDYILDASQFSLPEWIEKRYSYYDGHRWGGYEFQEKEPYAVNLTYYLSLIEALTTMNTLPEIPKWEYLAPNVTKIWFENRGWITSVSYLNALNNMILRHNLPDDVKNETGSYGITMYNHPLNLTESQRNKENLRVSAMGVVHAICIIFALSFIPASFTVYLIEERQCGGKHLHLVSGVKPITYWTANFFYDTTKYLIPVGLSVLLFIAFDAKAYISSVSIWAFILLLLLYGWASIPLMYPASYLFKIPSTAFVVLACANLFIGVITTVSTFVLEQFGETDPELEEIGIMLKKLFLVCPQYCLGRGLIELVRLDIFSSAQNNFSIAHREVNRFRWDSLGKMHFFLFIEGILFFLLNLIIDYKQILLILCKRKRNYSKGTFEDEDEDVHAERLRVLSQDEKNSTLFSENLTKFYSRKKHPSVDSLCFTIGKGECFGLLGVNGAGKTSTFKMLTGDVLISSGKAWITGYDVELDRDNARQHFGYCPQEDGFDSLLNGYEILELYGRLRGMGFAETKEASLLLIQTLGLLPHARRRAGTYSGGNKRKLSTAIALIGDPDIVFLDEPTSGMDPGARRQLWKIIIRLIHMGKSVVLTSHSMEECEALCTRLGLMVNGQFVCLGSIQHLKNRFGKGYTLNVRCEEIKEKEFVEYMEANLPSSVLVDSHCTQLKFSIPQDKAQLREIFEYIQAAKQSNLIQDYSLSQTTLDDIFVKFASKQRDALDR